jgi:enamine deaminase RidA (YjgF/YER057c/UK114 family)
VKRSNPPTLSNYFRAATPASTLVQVVHLARPDLMLEIEVIAVVK